MSSSNLGTTIKPIEYYYTSKACTIFPYLWSIVNVMKQFFEDDVFMKFEDIYMRDDLEDFLFH